MRIVTKNGAKRYLIQRPCINCKGIIRLSLKRFSMLENSQEAVWFCFRENIYQRNMVYPIWWNCQPHYAQWSHSYLCITVGWTNLKGYDWCSNKTLLAKFLGLRGVVEAFVLLACGLRQLVIGARRLKKKYWSHFQGLQRPRKSSWTFQPHPNITYNRLSNCIHNISNSKYGKFSVIS